MDRAEEQVKEAQTALAERQRLYEEVRQLVKTGGIARTEAETRLSALRAQEAATRQAEINVRERQEILERHQLLAPFGGMISAKMTEVGEWVQTGVAVLDLVEVDAVRFDVQAPQERYADLAAETPVTVRLDSRPQEEFPARILTSVPVKDAEMRTFLVRLGVDAPAGVLSPGVSGRAIFRVRRSSSAVTIPRDAIVRQPDGGA